ncbi:hypothetical protein [Cylindrospermum stagnale]|uniref:hypothetical protein n=1 Tax=Cylindrospermum stagnale TaxID=142864 RepID=UPI0012F6717C|nr:hypothetical protein [Cylindrospermum stagnale]
MTHVVSGSDCHEAVSVPNLQTPISFLDVLQHNSLAISTKITADEPPGSLEYTKDYPCR